MSYVALKLTEGKPRKSKIPYARFLVKRHGFYFVDVPKTSSTSIRHDLGKRFGLPYKKYSSKDPRTMLASHMPAAQLRKLFGKQVWNKLFTFTMVRNPWDRMYCWYHYLPIRKLWPQQPDFREFVLAIKNAKRFERPANKHPPTSSIAQRHAKKPESPVSKQRVNFNWGHPRRCAASYICDREDRILVDYVARYERREDDLERIRKRLNMKALGGRLLNKSTPRGDHYSRHYDDETREIVRTLYARDIELFGYEFEDKR